MAKLRKWVDGSLLYSNNVGHSQAENYFQASFEKGRIKDLGEDKNDNLKRSIDERISSM